MKYLLISLLLLTSIYFLGNTIVKEMLTDGSRAALIMAGIDRADTEATIREHYRTTITEHADEGTLTLDYADLNEDGRIDVIAILNSKATCGSGGCIATLYMQDEAREFKPLEFTYAVKKLEALESITNGMHDIRINDDAANRMIWSGDHYILETL